ncbi:MAG: (Fe-S)-binding protein, partial [Deltaproteobacteria bacterium]|nr:(Fe-S)-binding protein [Deltaproteobacteria bacterium]
MNHLQKVKANVLKCMGCGVCRGVWERQDESMCPVWATNIGFEDSTPRGRVTVAQDLLDGHLVYSLPLAESIYRCTDCASCVVTCDAMDPETGKAIIDVPSVVRAMRMDLVENSLVPSPVRDYFKAVYVNGNPYKISQTERGAWAKGTNVQAYSGQEYLLYVGDAGSFDERGVKMARFVAEALEEGGVEFGILGSEEMSDGNDALALGESGLFEYLAQTNINTFKEKGITKVISLDPHSFNAFKNEYPDLGGEFEVLHYTQVLAGLIKSGAFPAQYGGTRVTYHDPCYLGRHNDIYEAPREILNAIPGLDLVEMKRNGKTAFCCGGGGGNFYTDMLGGGSNSANRIRVREAAETGAEILAVACPLCAKM